MPKCCTCDVCRGPEGLGELWYCRKEGPPHMPVAPAMRSLASRVEAAIRIAREDGVPDEAIANYFEALAATEAATR